MKNRPVFRSVFLCLELARENRVMVKLEKEISDRMEQTNMTILTEQPLPQLIPTKEHLISQRFFVPTRLDNPTERKQMKQIQRLHTIFQYPTEPFLHALKQAQITCEVVEAGVFLRYRSKEYLMIPTGIFIVEENSEWTPIQYIYSTNGGQLSVLQAAQLYLKKALIRIFSSNINNHAFIRLLNDYVLFAYDLRNNMERILIDNKGMSLNKEQKRVLSIAYGIGYEDIHRDSFYNKNLRKALNTPTDGVRRLLENLSLTFAHTPTGTVFRREGYAFFVGPRGVYLLWFNGELMAQPLYERQNSTTPVEDAKTYLSHSLNGLFNHFTDGYKWLPAFEKLIIGAYEFNN